MVDDHLIFLVTIPIHDGSNESSLHGKAAKPSAEKGSERVRKQTQRVLKQVREHLYNKEQAKNIYFYDLSAIFARKLQKSHLKTWLNVV